MTRLTGYIGTYSSPQSCGIYRFTFDSGTGAFTSPALFFEAKDSKCVALCGSWLAAPLQEDGRAGIVLLDTRVEGFPQKQTLLSEAVTSCFLAWEDTMLFTANYHEGSVSVYKKKERLELVKRIVIAPKAGCHQVLFHPKLLLVPCLELDCIRLFDRETFAPAGELSFPAGSGPRHGVWDAAHRRLFVVTERNNQLFSFRAEEEFSFVQEAVVPILSGEDQGKPAASAAIRLSPDERFLYVSTRDVDWITVFAVEGNGVQKIQQISCGGQHPRDMILTPDGQFLLVLNRDSHNLVCFPRHADTGKLGTSCAQTAVYQGSGIVLDSEGILE